MYRSVQWFYLLYCSVLLLSPRFPSQDRVSVPEDSSSLSESLCFQYQPNSRHILVCSSGYPEKVRIRVLNREGHLVMGENIALLPQVYIIDLSRNSPDMYYIRLEDHKGYSHGGWACNY